MVSFANINMKSGRTLYKNSPGVTQTFFGVDFNPTATTEYSGPGDSTNVYVTEEATIDCSALTNGHEVIVGLYKFENTSGSTQTNFMSTRRQKLISGTRTTIYQLDYGNITMNNGNWGYMYTYIGIDWDEIWSDGDYRVQGMQNGNVLITSNTVSIINVYPMSTLRNAGYFWIHGDNIHYIDSSYNSSQGFEHVITNDGSATYVGTEYSGSIWCPTSNSDQLAYVDENGYKRLTHGATARYGGPVYVGTDKSGYIWVSNSTADYGGYAYLCFVGDNGYKYRIMNGTV